MAKTLQSTVLKNTEVHETKEYNVFKLDKRNRPLSEEKVKSFMKMFQKGLFFLKEFPAIIDDNFVVLDGQHRYEACKRLSLPFYFRWADRLSIDNVVDVQSNSGWKTMDFLHSYIQQGNQNYIILYRFIKKYEIPATTAVMLLSSATHKKTSFLITSGFYEGNFLVRNEKNAHVVAEAVIDFVELGFSGARNRSFIQALYKVMAHPEYSHKRMMDKMKSFGASLLHLQINADFYLRNLEELYNYKQPEGARVRFL